MDKVSYLSQNNEIITQSHFFPDLSDKTNFTQDVSTHSYITLTATYSLMGFAWAGKAGLNFIEMILSGLSCFIMGWVIILAEKKHMPTYISRFFGVAVAAFSAIAIAESFRLSVSLTAVMLAVVMPVATGMMIVDGIYTYIRQNKKSGVKKIGTGFLCSLSLASAVYFVSMMLGEKI